LHAPWGNVFSPDEIDKHLNGNPVKVVAMVHGETSTGVLQPLSEISEIVHKHHALLLVDAVTSLGGVPVRVDQVGIDLCYSGSQKCLGCPPGLGPVTISPQAEEIIANRKTPVSNWYLDLNLLKNYWGPERVYHHTPPTSMLYGLYEGLKLTLEEGLQQRWDRHLSNAKLLWQGLAELDLQCLVYEPHRLPPLTTVKIPHGVDDGAIRKQLLDNYNIEIAGGLGELKGKIWRIGLMGYSSRPENVMMLLGALQTVLKR
jgi:alanine-glyoxylate transaminase/serine-glyoxylate transaminase/serine-pyruvate transaminase